MEIHSKRCIIRPFTDADIDAFMGYRNNEEWMRHQGFKGLSRQAYASALLGKHSFAQGMQLAVAGKDDGRLIGDVYLKEEDGRFWLGYTIAPQYARQGYAFEAASAVIGWLRGQGHSTVAAGVLPQNHPSVRLLEKLGFCYTATSTDGELLYTLAL